MPRFQITVRMPDGTLRVDEVDASSRFEVAHRLRRDGVQAVRVAEVVPVRTRRASRQALVLFTRQCAVMLAAGLPLTEALQRLAEHPPRRGFGENTRALQRAVEGGASLSQAMTEQPRTFPAMYTAMIAAGEQGGALVTVMERLAQWLQQRDAVQRRVMGALLYPALIVVSAIVAVLVLLWTVVPTFEQLLGDAGVALPAATRFVVQLSQGVREHGLILGGAIAGVVLVAAVDAQRDAGRVRRDRLLFALPLVGPLLQQASVARSARTLAMLLTSGVGLLAALDLTARAAGSGAMTAALLEARQRVAGGSSIAEAFHASGTFPDLVVSMLAVGERTGALADMLERLASFYGQLVDASIRDLLSLLEPILMLGVGTVIAGVVVSMYLPVFDMISAV